MKALSLLFLFAYLQLAFANVDLKAGMVITGSVTINANRYTLNAPADH
jgi:hypothetical protein